MVSSRHPLLFSSRILLSTAVTHVSNFTPASPSLDIFQFILFLVFKSSNLKLIFGYWVFKSFYLCPSLDSSIAAVSSSSPTSLSCRLNVVGFQAEPYLLSCRRRCLYSQQRRRCILFISGISLASSPAAASILCQPLLLLPELSPIAGPSSMQ